MNSSGYPVDLQPMVWYWPSPKPSFELLTLGDAITKARHQTLICFIACWILIFSIDILSIQKPRRCWKIFRWTVEHFECLSKFIKSETKNDVNKVDLYNTNSWIYSGHFTFLPDLLNIFTGPTCDLWLTVHDNWLLKEDNPVQKKKKTKTTHEKFVNTYSI